MSKDNGTPLCTNGQFATVASRIITALPKALEFSRLDIKTILNHTGEGERLSLAIAEALRMLHYGHPATILPYLFPIWGTIKLGAGPKTAAGIREAIDSAGMFIGEWGDEILGKLAFTVGSEETEVDIAVASNAELGFKEGAKLKNTYARINELGYALLPNVAGLQVLLQCWDKLKNCECFLVATETREHSEGFRGLLNVGCNGDGQRYLDGHSGNPNGFWTADTRFLFQHLRK